jgi:hypothetical protein
MTLSGQETINHDDTRNRRITYDPQPAVEPLDPMVAFAQRSASMVRPFIDIFRPE